MNWNYEAIKQLAAESGVRVTDLLALAPQNDPFYTGRPAEVAAAQWFFILYRQFGYSGGVHLRRIHYQIVSQNPPVKMPNGETYENTDNCWQFLNNAAKWARYLDLVPAEQFVDRRNPDAIIHSRFQELGDWLYENPNPAYAVNDPASWDSYTVPALPELPDLPWYLPDPPAFSVWGYDGIQQGYLVEVWAEKTTMNDILIPLCREYGINLVTGAGELSITAVIEFIKRVEAADRPARILYISDFDPAGLGMPISVARKIEFYMRQMDESLDVKLNPVVLTPEQIAHFNLPRVPVKDSDKRKANFESAYGQGQVELDALEALYPGELRDIVREAILNYYDDSLTDRAYDVKRRLEGHLDGARDEAIYDNAQDKDALEEEFNNIKVDYETTRAAFAEMIAQFQPQLDAYNDRLAKLRNHGATLYETIHSQLYNVTVDLADYALPDPDLPEEPQGQLYESERSYMEQLTHYHAQRHNVKQLGLEEA